MCKGTGVGAGTVIEDTRFWGDMSEMLRWPRERAGTVLGRGAPSRWRCLGSIAEDG